MTGEILRPKPLIEVTPEKLQGLENVLGPEGHGAFVLHEVISTENLEQLQAEIFDPERVQFHDVHSRYYNKRGKLIIQNHTVFALKLLQGDPSYIDRVPMMRQLATEIEGLVRSFGQVFPSLIDWTADEMSLHRYDDPEIGLSFHKDNLRFPGLVAVATLEGESDFCIQETVPIDEELEKVTIHKHPVRPGDLVFTRQQGLFPSDKDIRGEHAVLNLRTPYRTAFIVRDNNRPDESLEGFNFANWGTAPPG